MKKYPKYKNTNIEWLEQIPEHWEVKKLKWLSIDVITGKTPSSSKVEYFKPEFNWFNPSDINSFKVPSSKRKISFKAVEECNMKVFPKHSVMLVSIGTIGKISIAMNSGTSNQQINTIIFNEFKMSPFFGFYFLYANKEMIKHFSNISLIAILNQSQTEELILAVPPLSEQKAIADYLDKKTNEIDQIIEAKKKLIALYNEEKSALINKAVTKGIDDKAKLKPSGIEWLGDIPQHWEVKKLNRIADITLGKTLSSKKKGDMTEEYYLRSANIDWYKPRLDSIKKMWFTPHEKSKMKVEKYDLIVSEGGDVGRTCIWNDEIENCYIQNSVHRVRFENRIEALYYLNLFVLYGKLGVYDSVVNRISIAHLTVDKISSLVFPFPPLKEQEKIVEYIEKNVRVIDKKIANAKRLIELMTEYRTTLISEVVTGKVKVV